jgi:hypothetical protein
MADGVDTFRRIVGLIGRWSIYAVVIIVGIASLIAGAAYAYQWYNYDRHAQNVAIDLSTDRAACNDDKFPVRVRIMNDSSKILERTTFTLAARFKDRSTDIAKYHSFEDDHISQPKFGYSNCWSVPEFTQPVADPRVLDWSIKHKTFYFRD